MRRLLALALTAASAAAMAHPPDARPAPPPPIIQVTGEARVSETPDRVYLDIGVTTQARESQAAAEQNAARSSAVLTALRQVSGPAALLTTTDYSITPNYSYSREGASSLVGYTVRNIVQVRLDDLTRVSRIIDAATHAGSNDVQSIRFALRDEQAAHGEALRQAALDARRDAQSVAAALGLKIVRVLSVSEQGVTPIAYRQVRLSVQTQTAAAVPTPVQSGSLDVNATVTLTVEVAPR